MLLKRQGEKYAKISPLLKMTIINIFILTMNPMTVYANEQVGELSPDSAVLSALNSFVVAFRPTILLFGFTSITLITIKKALKTQSVLCVNRLLLTNKVAIST